MAKRRYDGGEGAGAQECQRNWRRRDLGDMVHHRMECLSHGGGVGRNALVIALMREFRIHQENIWGEKGWLWKMVHSSIAKNQRSQQGAAGVSVVAGGQGAES